MKKIIILIIVGVLSYSIYYYLSRPSEFIKGKILYLTDINSACKPDVGSIVYAIDTSKAESINYKHFTILNFIYLNDAKFIYNELYIKIRNENIDMKDFSILTEPYYKFKLGQKSGVLLLKELDKKASENIKILINSRDVYHAVVDKNGNYSINLNPGVYHIIVISKNTKGFSKLENNGKIYTDTKGV